MFGAVRIQSGGSEATRLALWAFFVPEVSWYDGLSYIHDSASGSVIVEAGLCRSLAAEQGFAVMSEVQTAAGPY